jgi:hypothetical protein
LRPVELHEDDQFRVVGRQPADEGGDGIGRMVAERLGDLGRAVLPATV